MGCGSSTQAGSLNYNEPQEVEESRPSLVAQATRTSLHSQVTRPSLAKQATRPLNEDPKSLQFINAARDNNFTTLKVYASIVDLNVKDDAGDSALIWACRHGNIEMVSFLLDKRNKGMKWTDVDQKNKLGFTPLHEAASKGHIEIISILLSHGANPEEKDCNGRKPRDIAANAEIVAIFDQNSNANIVKEEEDISNDQIENIDDHDEVAEKELRDFFEAAMYGDVEKVKAYVVIRHMDVNIRDMADWTAVMAASQRGNVEVVQYLLENKANVKLTNNSRANALHYADNGEIARMLIEADAPINSQNEFGESPLHTACNAHFLSPGILNVVELLISKGANCNMKNNEGQTPLHIAVRQESVELIKMLMKGGADPTIKDHTEQTPMDLATSDEIRYLM